MEREDWTEELVDLLERLIRIETENPPGNERPCTEFVVEWFSDRGIDAELVGDPYPDRPQAVARIGEGNPTFVFNGHVDVVPAGDRDRWNHDPYGAEIEGNTLYGRGASDMKSGVATGMMAAAILAERIEGGNLGGSVVVQAVVDEEVIGPGTKRLLELGYDGDYGVVLEPTGLRTATSEKGHVWYEITVDGEPSHGGRPDEGVNAAVRAHRVVDALLEYDREVRRRERDPLGRAYASVTGIHSGTKENVIPGSASVTLDRRFLPDQSVDDVDAELDAVLTDVSEASGFDVEWGHTTTVVESSRVPVDCELARTMRRHSNDVAGVSSDPWAPDASSDLRNLVNDAGMEAVTWGPGDPSAAHTVDESVDLRDVESAVEILVRTAEDIFTSGSAFS